MKTSEQAHAYTPGLKVKRDALVSKERKLPVPGEVHVKQGSQVGHETLIATAFVEGDAHVINGANLLKVEREDVADYLVKRQGEQIKRGEVLLRYSAFFGLSKRTVESPVDGIVEAVSKASGQIIVRESVRPINLDAYVSGKVLEVLPREGAIVETRAAFIQGIFGVGGEAHGRLRVLTRTEEEPLTLDRLGEDQKGCIIVGGSEVVLDTLRQAAKIGVSGIIVGGIEPLVLSDFTGEEIGVAITGEEQLGVTLMITEGFGRMNMSDKTFNMLKSLEGEMAHMSGATQIRAGVLRPEVIIPHEEGSDEKTSGELSSGMVIGTPVRIIREPYFGVIGEVASLVVELQKLESESYVRVVEVKLEDGRRVVVPRANVEIIEE